MKHHKYLLLFGLIMAGMTGCGVSTDQSISSDNSTDPNSSVIEENSLELLAFETIEEKDIPVKNATSLGDSEEIKVVDEDELVYFRAIIKNSERDPFVDLVVYTSDLDTMVVFNEGNGDYQCSSTTVYEDYLWVTKVFFSYNPTVMDGNIEIKEITFLHSSSLKKKAAIKNSVITKLKYHKHVYGDYIPFKDVTYYEDGDKYRVCEGCQVEKHEAIPAYYKSYYDVLDFTLSADNSYYSVAVKDSSKNITTVVIPNVFNELPVKEIAKNGFSECDKLESVVIAPSIEVIEDNAFRSCSSLSSVIFGGNTRILKNNVFESCHSMKEISLPKTISSMGGSCFAGCYQLSEIVLPDLIEIPNDAFFATPFTIIELPSTTKVIRNGAFFNANYLTIVIINNEVELIEEAEPIYRMGGYTVIPVDFFYYGTEEEWNQKEGHENISTSLYYYSEQEPISLGQYWHYVNGVPTKW